MARTGWTMAAVAASMVAIGAASAQVAADDAAAPGTGTGATAWRRC